MSMKKIFLLLLLLPALVHAQVENVIVETYYISDSTDAVDTTFGILPAGSKTYRIYIDLAEGCKLNKIYGNVNHPLIIKSSAVFFNHLDRGKSFGKDINKNNLDENIVALDTWLTLGQSAKFGTSAWTGLLKSDDSDGSFIGGINNDSGLIANTNALAGIPVTLQDGYQALPTAPTNWLQDGIIDLITGDDSTIFGSLKPGCEFVSDSASLQCSGAVGINPYTNKVLVAQLTTIGELSFELNVEVEELDGAGTKLVWYVANDSVLLPGEYLSGFLKYPQECGCTDPDYVEYGNSFACSNNDLCQTLVVYGCMDTSACNYNPGATYNVQSLCCYPGYCSDRDLALVCPQLNNERNKHFDFTFYPNPVSDMLNIQLATDDRIATAYFIYDAYGRLIEEKVLQSEDLLISVNTSTLAKGIYMIKMFDGQSYASKVFVKD